MTVTVDEETPARALAVFAHPDDPEVACAGTLARWVQRGCEAHLLIANAGDKGSDDPSTDPLQLAAVRAEEAREAAEVIGLSSVQFLDVADGELENTSELRTALIECVRAIRPDAVIAPDPTSVFFGDRYVNHHDHRALGWAVLDVCGSMAGGALYAPTAGAAHQVDTLLLAGTLAPDTWIDIAGVIDVKVAALACHASRLGAEPEMAAGVVESRAAEAGEEAGLRYAEGFRRLSLRS